MQHYLAAPADERARLVAEGVRLARERRADFKKLILENPREALRQAVPVMASQQLPDEIAALLEERVSGRGVLRTYLSYPATDTPAQPPVLRYAEFENGPTYEAHVYGRRAETVKWVTDASLNGVAMDRHLAVSERPLRWLEPGEAVAPGKTVVSVCPVCGKPTGAERIAVEAFGDVVYLCNELHVAMYEEILIQAEGSTGGPQRFTGILPPGPAPCVGQLRVLYIPMTFADQNQVPCTEATCYAVAKDVGDFFYRASYGRLTYLQTVTPPVKLPHNEAWYKQKDTSDGVSKEIDGLGLEHQHAREEARKLGYDSYDYDAVVVRLNGGPRTTGGWGGGSSVWVYQDAVGTVAHELGHCFGLAHANFWDTGGASAIGPGGNQEYGHSFDIMGTSGMVPSNHHNPKAKNQIKWLADNFIQTVTESGLYRVHAFDQPNLDADKRYTLKIVKDNQRTYWSEVRTLFDGVNKWVANGMILGWNWPQNGGSNLQLIDTTPGSPGAKNDAPIVLGQTFSDFEAGIHLTTVAVNNDADGRSLDVMVNLGSFPSNQPPTLSLAVSAANVPTNTPVTFSASANDPDGDTLAYHWLCSDNTTASTAILGSNAPTFTRSFQSNGKYLVTCIVSDMKGGAATRHQLVTVGNGGSVYSISGRVTCDGQGLQGVHVSTGANNAVLTDSDGYYTIPNLAAGTYMVSPQLYGYSFSELFNNNVTLGPDFAGADFAAELTPRVSLTASVPTAYEAGSVAGKFTLTRTGPDTDPLTVKIVPVFGSAATGDYSLNPAPTNGSPYNTVTIPAGQSSLDITVTPVNDTSIEGPETVVMQLGLDAAYVISGPATATVVIEDDDTTLPKVSITAQTIAAVENPLRASRFTITRTGPTVSNLIVKLAYTGTASNGVDYISLASSNIMPAGAASADITVTPVDDGVSEGFETIVATLVTDAAYLKDPNASSATVLMVDDDQQVVSLEVPKATAREVDLSLPGAVPDPGVFVVTRSGDVSLPLTVYYAVSGTALHGVDYEALPGLVTIPAGETRASIVITPRFDSLGEPAETVSLQLAASSGNYKLGAVHNATLTILDAGDLPTVEVIGWKCAKEPSTNGVFRFSLRGSTNTPVTVNYTVSGTATPGIDYTNLTGTVSLNGTGAVVDVTVPVINDGDAEELETITVTITPSPNYQTWEPTRSATIWLYDDEQPTVFVDAHTTSSSGIATLAENSTGTNKFYLSRTGGTTGDLTVNYIMTGTASNGVDYQWMTGSAVITNGWPGVDVPIVPIQDALFEGTETITLSLLPGGYARGPDSTMYLTDDETSSLTVGFASATSVASESAGAIGIPVILSATSAFPVTVQYSVLSSNVKPETPLIVYTSLPRWLRFSRTGDVFRAHYSPDGVAWTQIGAAQTNAFVDPIWAGLAVCSRSDGVLATGTFDNVTLTPDPGGVFEGRDIGFVSAYGSDSEAGGVYTVTGSGGDMYSDNSDELHYVAQPVSGDFTFTARLTASSGGSSPYIGLMIREDMRNIARHLFVGQRGSDQTWFFCRKNTAITAQNLGVDYQCPGGTLTFAPGTLTNTIPLTITDDTLAEPNEQVVLTLRFANGAALGINQHVLAIADNDTAPLQPSIGFAAANSTIAENGVPAVMVTLSQPATNTVSVNYEVTGGTAVSPDDYTLPPGTLSFVAGETVQTIPIALVDDSLVESNETVQITLSAPSGATLTTVTNHTLTITDNDLPVVTLVASDPTASETGDPGEWTFTRTGAATNDLLVSFTVAGTASSGSDYAPLGTSITIPTGSNSVALTLSPLADAAVEGYETVIVRLTNSPSYVIGSLGTGTVTITDANISTVSIAATTPTASETGPSNGVFTISRDGPTNSALTVYFSVTGTASAGTDYTSLGSSIVIAANRVSTNLLVRPINDSLTEGVEYVVVSLQTNANYLVGAPSFDSVAIADNDSPPTVFISQPAAKAVQLAPGNGLVLEATATDDGAPGPLSFTWTQFSGPGSVTFGVTNTAATTATFSTNGLYILRVSVTDGQFSVSDDVTVQVGGFAPADWVDVSLGTPSTRGKSGLVNGTFTILASGTGFSGTADSGHFVCRQMNGAASVVARVTGFTGAGTNALAGVMVRETNYRGARRALLGVRPNGAVEWRRRGALGGSDTMTSGGTNALPLWVKLERAGDVITAYQAPDTGGAPSAWVQVGVPLTNANLRADVDVGIAATAGAANTLTSVAFDNVALAPAPMGPAFVAEDLGNTSFVGTNFLAGSTNVIVGAGSLFTDTGRYLFQQYVGDVTVTARILSHTASGMSAKGGVMIRDTSLDSAPHGMMGIAHYWGGYFVWRNVIGGSAGTSYGGSSVNPQWIRVVRKGNSIRAWKAPNSGSSPGTWVQQGGTQVFSADAPIYVGLAVDSASSTATNLVKLDNFTVVTDNTAPVVNAGSGGTFTNASPIAIHATVTDDGQPNPPGATTYQWSQLSGPGTVTFGNATNLDTTATFSLPGVYVLRLTADDGEVRVFDDVSYTVYHTPFEAWQAEHFGAESGGPNAAPTADPDRDGILNLMEYALNLDPNTAGLTGLPVQSSRNISGSDYLTLTYTRVKAATDITYAVEVSGDLIGWNSGPGYTATVSMTDNPDGITQTVVVRDLISMASATSRFIRLKIIQP